MEKEEVLSELKEVNKNLREFLRYLLMHFWESWKRENVIREEKKKTPRNYMFESPSSGRLKAFFPSGLLFVWMIHWLLCFNTYSFLFFYLLDIEGLTEFLVLKKGREVRMFGRFGCMGVCNFGRFGRRVFFLRRNGVLDVFKGEMEE